MNDVKTPNKVFFELTRACNLTCTHCLNSSGEKLSDELTREQILKIIRDLGNLQLQEIRFTGGEPTISPVLIDAIQIASDMGIRTSIGTNGTSITNAKAEEMARAGLNAAIVSIDGDQKTHDLIRGEGSYHRTWRGIQALRSARINVRINAVAMRKTLDSLPSLAETCQQNGVTLNVRRFIPSGRATGEILELLEISEYQSLWASLQEYVLEGTVDGHYRTDDLGHCSAGTTGMVILPNGDVQSCGFLSDLGEPNYGNATREGIEAIWTRMGKSPFIAQAREHLRSINQRSENHPKTNCLAIAVGTNSFVQLRRKT